MSKKTQIANLILAMTQKERLLMADDFAKMQRNADDDASGWELDNTRSFSNMLKFWAKGLGSME